MKKKERLPMIEFWKLIQPDIQNIYITHYFVQMYLTTIKEKQKIKQSSFQHPTKHILRKDFGIEMSTIE